MLENEFIDIVDIAVPIKYHAEIAIYALRKRKHVIIEKPIAANSKEAEEMIKTAKLEDVKLSVFHTMKAYPIIQKTKKIIDDNEIGKTFLLHFLVSVGKLQPWVSQQGGELWEVGMHRIYLVQYLFGKINHIKVQTSDFPLRSQTLTLFTEKGIGEIHLLNSDFNCPDAITIHGKEGRIVISYLAFNTLIKIKKLHNENWRTIFFREIKLNAIATFLTFFRGIEYLVKGNKLLPHAVIIDNFVDSIQGKNQLLIEPEEGLESLRVIEEIEQIAKLNTCT